MQYNNTFVDEKYSKIVEPNLYGDAILQPKKTFNDQYQGDANAGLVKIYRHKRDASGDPQKSAGDFTHDEASNELIDLRLNNAFRKSKKIYNVIANSVGYALAEETLQTAVKDNQEDWQYAGLACLVTEGTALTPTTATTAASLKKTILDARKQVRKAHGRADTVIASVDVYSLMLEIAGTQYTPSSNENTLTTGRVGTWLGMTWYEGDLLDKAAAKYNDHAGASQTADLTKVEFVMYDHKAFHVVNNLMAQRIVDAVDFVGSYAQNEINSGFRVSNAKSVVIKKIA